MAKMEKKGNSDRLQSSLGGLMLKLKLQYFSHLIQRPTCWERLMLGKIESMEKWVAEDEMVG